MDNPFYQLIASLTPNQCNAIYRDYLQLEKTGMIGDGPLREVAEQWIAITNGAVSVSSAMRDVVFAILQREYERQMS